MKPLKLYFKGINSFSEPAEIDFEKLTDSGIFDIFGDTGSGKSTILDSINFALYGDVDRSKKKTDIINYNCDGAEVKFSFDMLIGGNRKTYTVERSIKKKSGLIKAALYEEDGNSSLCIADNTSTVTENIENIIGLKAEDFRKCIALPQGEFARFVTSAPADRLKLIERLFSLSKYGEKLKERLAAKESIVNAEFNGVEGELSAYSDISRECVSVFERNLSENRKIVERLDSEIESAKRAYSDIGRLYESRLELDGVSVKLSELLEKRGEIEALRRSLKILPDCKAVCDRDGELCSLKKKSESLRAELSRNREALNGNDAEIARLNRKIADEEYDKKILCAQQLLASYKACDGIVEEIENYGEKLNKLRSKYLSLSETGKKLFAKETACKQKTQDLQKAYDDCAGTDLNVFFDGAFRNSVLLDEYRKQIVYLGDLRESIKGYDDRSDLYSFVREELTARIKYYENLILSSVGQEIDAEKTVKQMQAAFEKRERISRELNASLIDYKELSKEVTVNAGECEHVKREGEETASRIKELKNKLSTVFGEQVTDYRSAVAAVENNIKKLTASAETDKNLLDSAAKRREAINIRLTELTVLIQSTDAEIKKTERELGEYLKKSGFDNIQDCKNLIDRFANYIDAESEIKIYDESLISLSARRAQLEKTEGISNVTQESVKAAEKLCADLDERARAAHGEIKLALNKIEELTVKLEKKTQIENSLKKIAEEKNLITQLKELTKNNRFLEYIASEYLSEISAIASATLLKLTDGRYFLNYVDTFYVGDNYNGGNLRGVNTLSGGETFLVSLSLALALSSVICAKSSNSIEFFFLDEGFGTLDENLIDTVMNSLEKLKSSEFTIGIISHVEELKHRIESKILVSKATESRGSTLRIIC